MLPVYIILKKSDQEVEDVILFLSGHYQEIKKRLETKMWLFSLEEQYEAAAKVRDQLEAIKSSFTSQVVQELNQQRDQDIIGFARVGPEVAIVQILIRRGSWHHSNNYSFSYQPWPSEEILRSFLNQAYQGSHTLPHDILLPFHVSDEISTFKPKS